MSTKRVEAAEDLVAVYSDREPEMLGHVVLEPSE
jgi:hypothetical protein